MKKIILSIIAIMMMLVIMPVAKAEELPKVTNHEKVTIHIFWGNGCPNCTNAIKYFYNLGDKYEDYIEIKTYEVWYNQDNSKFAVEVAGLLEHELEGVPFLVVGEKYISGWGDTVGETLIGYALDYYEDKKYNDVVQKALEETENDVVETSLEDAYEDENVEANSNNNTNKTEGGKYDAIIIAGIFVVLIGGFAALVIIGKK